MESSFSLSAWFSSSSSATRSFRSAYVERRMGTLLLFSFLMWDRGRLRAVFLASGFYSEGVVTVGVSTRLRGRIRVATRIPCDHLHPCLRRYAFTFRRRLLVRYWRGG